MTTDFYETFYRRKIYYNHYNAAMDCYMLYNRSFQSLKKGLRHFLMLDVKIRSVCWIISMATISYLWQMEKYWPTGADTVAFPHRFYSTGQEEAHLNSIFFSQSSSFFFAENTCKGFSRAHCLLSVHMWIIPFRALRHSFSNLNSSIFTYFVILSPFWPFNFTLRWNSHCQVWATGVRSKFVM